MCIPAFNTLEIFYNAFIRDPNMSLRIRPEGESEGCVYAHCRWSKKSLTVSSRFGALGVDFHWYQRIRLHTMQV